ncbi:hypothetical protein [Chryseobacterium geocarposphaerae]|uniref:Uncharacterized protein n=1 Tax=Chryseobacterium geocarposphaerae TaxID=1416776 RepID=A0A2M9C9C7_9FLAO|nr:hypothetical protein [Chryseobacterium geocarposphaerae]PJJ67448.1 hypothetical protein CLV73_1461 [Chryseobacterium geocarposphaerae]
MEEINKLTEREELKTYFETGKYPTQIQFAELIDSLRHKADALSYRDIVNIANRLEALDSGYIEYSVIDVGDQKFSIVMSSEGAEDLVIELKNTSNGSEKLKIFGKVPFIFKTKEFPAEGLGINEYYHFTCSVDFLPFERLFGNNLPTIPDGLEFGTYNGVGFMCGINKYPMDQQINIVNTSIKFVNKTEEAIQYRAQAGIWTDIYRGRDIVTDHYDMWDNLYFYYKADLQKIDRNIECRVYNADNDQLLITASLLAGQDNKEVWGNGEAKQIRNIRIECDYQ